MELQINQKFKDLIPPLSYEEYDNLRESIMNDGCRDAIIVWDGVIVDGHNRYEICTELDIPFSTIEKSFESEDDACEWIMRNQLARRNLPDIDRGRITLMLKDLIAARAKINMLATQNNNAGAALTDLSKQVEPLNTRRELAKISGLSEGTLAKIEKVDKEAPLPIREAMGKTISIDRAAQLNNALKSTPESERDTEAKRLLDAAYKEKMDKICREEKIMKVLHNIFSSASIDYEYICPECVSVYVRRSPSTVARLIKDVDHEIGLLKELRELFVAAEKRGEGKRDE